MPECTLCKNNVSSLVNSHLIPAGFYRDMKRASGGYTSATQKVASNTSRQVTSQLLCNSCEQLFNNNGEKWVLENYNKNGSFRLRQELAKLVPAQQKSGVKYFSVPKSAVNIDVQKMIYFAASVFWRASVDRWGFPVGQYPYQGLQLGPYTEELRKFLLGDAAFPCKASLGIFVSENPVQDGVIFPQSANRNDGGFRRHGFFIPGLTFILLLGNKLPKEIENECAVRKNILMQSDIGENLVLNMRKNLATPRSR